MLGLSWFDPYETRRAEKNLGVVCGGHGGLVNEFARPLAQTDYHYAGMAKRIKIWAGT